MAFKQFCGSEFWVDSLTWNTTSPEFSPCFQKTALVWIPCGFLWLFLPAEIYILNKKSKQKYPCTGLNVTKMIFGILLIVFSLFDMIHWLIFYSRTEEEIPYANINSPFIFSITYLLATVLMAIEKKQGIGSSGVLFIFWLISTLAKIFVFQSQMMAVTNPNRYQSMMDYIICVITFPLIIAQLILSSFSDTAKPDSKSKSEQQISLQSPEINSSFLNRLFFAWFDSMTKLGIKRPLTQRDLWALSSDNQSKDIVKHFQSCWQDQFQKYQKSEEPGSEKELPTIMHALWISFRWPFIIAGFMRLIADMLAFATPLVLQMLIEYVTSDEPAWRGYFYAALLFMASLLQSVIYGQQYLLMFKTAMRVRSATISAIYRKALKINSSVKRSSTAGEIVNLMSVDVQRLMDLLPEFHVMWTAIVQIAIAMYMLWGYLGASVLAGLATMLLMIPVNGFIASRFKVLQISQMKAKDQRVKLMNEILNGMKVLKLYAWEQSFSDQVSDLRAEELKVMKKGAYLNAVASFVFNTVPFLVTLATFATYVLVDEHNVLDASKAFVSLSLFNIIRMPLFFIPMLFISMIQASVSFKRMNKFLTSNELDTDAVSHSEEAEHPIVVENGTFSWDKMENSSTLSNVNLTVKTGSLVAVVGPVGCGKSSLASAVLGDMDKITGTVNVKGSLAYVAQQAWIQNATLKDNIVFGKPLNLDKYNEVIDACALKPDFEILPGGDSTEIGEKGINLSGGQKQRVSLARAVYSDADVLILDDPLSAVDSHVGKHIFEHIIGSTGMLKDKTRLFITNNITFLPRVDSIVVMKDGKMIEQGSYEKLLEKKGDFAAFILDYLREFDDEEMSEEELTDLEGIAQDVVARIGSPALERQISRKLSMKSDPISDAESTSSDHKKKFNIRRQSSPTHSEAIRTLKSPKSVHEDQSKLIQVETTETGKVKWYVYLQYLRATGYWTVACYLLSYSFNAGFLVGSNIWLSLWSEDPPLANNTQNIPLRNLRLGVYGAFGFGQAICILLGSFVMAVGAIMASRKLHNLMLNNIVKCPMSFFDTTPLGRIVNRFSKDVDIVDTTIPMLLRPLIGTTLQVVSTLVVISMSTPIFLSLVIPIGIAFYIIQRYYISASRQLKRLESITRSPIFSYFSETLNGSSTIRAYNRTNEFIQESELRVDQNHSCYFPSIISNRWLSIRLEFLSNLIIFSASLFAVIGRETLDGGTIGLSISYAASLTNVLTFMVRMICDMETNIVAVERISEYAEAPTEAAWEVEDLDPPQSWPDKGVIVFQHYSTKYRPGLDLVLKDVSCHIYSGERIGIVGRTGAGKSSLTLALFRLIEPTEGAIFIDGVNTSLIGLHALRSKVTIIPQDPVLFSGTLRINLDPFNKHTDDDIWMALNLSHLKAFVTTLTMGLEHHIAEGGENISVGQRQLLCLARALLRKTKVLVLDEATAAVDMETDDLIQATIRKEFAQCTVMTIAHRLNTIMDSTRIIVLDQGQISEFDSPATLLQNKKSMFYGMAKDAKLVQ